MFLCYKSSAIFQLSLKNGNMCLSHALRIDILAGDAAGIRDMRSTVHHHKCSCGDKIKQRCFKSHENSMIYESTVKTGIPWPFQVSV